MFGKKIKGPLTIHLDEDQFCTTWSALQKNCAHNFHLNNDANYFNYIKQDGIFYTKPLIGKVYPFSEDPSKEGSRRTKKTFDSVQVIVVSKGALLKMKWGCADVPMRGNDGTPYYVGAHGTFFLQMDLFDGGVQASKFITQVASQGDGNVTDQKLREKLLEAYEAQVADAFQTALRESEYSFEDVMHFGLTPDQVLAISKSAYEKVKSIFSKTGFALHEFSANSIVDKTITIRKANV